MPGIFADIAKGIKADFPGKVKNYSLKAGFSESRLLADLRSDGVDAVAVLGGTGKAAAALLSSEYPVVMGAVSSVPLEGVGGVLLQPSSEVVMGYLHKLVPEVQALHLVYDPKKHRTALGNAEKAAEQVNIGVMAHPSSESKQTQKAIEDSLSGDAAARSAIWVMFGTKFDNAIKENLIKGSWGHPVVPFHYTFNPIKDVELFPFVLLPDWQGLGSQLAQMADRRLNGEKAEVAELQNINLWVNQKKSRHFGLKLDGDVRKEIDFT
ncbi:MAG: hypothetical protein OIF34_09520, partial [Porticoccaceae bacterium]|nr:hypothetical protein [Porticoccaceae bacterium]